MSRLTAKQQQDRARLRSIKLAERTAKSRYFSSVYGTGEKVQPHDMNGRPCGISVEAALAVEGGRYCLGGWCVMRFAAIQLTGIT